MDQPITEFRSNFDAWKERRPSSVAQLDADVAVSVGDRHGTWFVEFAWNAGGLHRAAELGVTNATALDDSVATDAVISVRASASSETHWTSTSIYERRRSLSRVSPDNLDEWVSAAVRVASSFTTAALTDAYALPAQAASAQ